MANFFGWKRKLSLNDRKFYKKKLTALITDPPVRDVARIYKLSYVEATDENFNKVVKYIKRYNYCGLLTLNGKIPAFEDELGRVLNSDIFEIYLIIDKVNKCYAAIIYVQLVEGNLQELKEIIKVNRFFYRLIPGKLLVYSA